MMERFVRPRGGIARGQQKAEAESKAAMIAGYFACLRKDERYFRTGME